MVSRICASSIHYLKESVFSSLNSQQKKVAAIAITILSVIVAGAIYYFRCCCLKDKKIDVVGSEPKIQIVDQEKYRQGLKVFSFKLFQELYNSCTKPNFFVSSVGVSFLLSMIKHGVDLATQEEIDKVVHLPASEDTVKKNACQLIKELEQQGVKTGGVVCAHSDYHLDPGYKKLIPESYQGIVENSGDPDAINSWVKKLTDGHIKEIVQPSEVYDSLILLASAFFYKGNWDESFKVKFNSFYLKPDESIEVPMIYRTGVFGYYENETFQAVKVNYEAGKEMSMIFVLPKDPGNYSCIEDAFDKIQTVKWTAHMQLELPKFKVEGELNIKEVLKQMGLGKIENADFLHMFDTTHEPTKQNLSKVHIDLIRQNYGIEVGEEGAKVAAATYAISKSGVPAEPKKEVSFNRPFFAALVYKDLPIMCGVIGNPKNGS